MAEFCCECMKKVFKEDIPLKEVVLSDDLELCEECNEYKRVVVSIGKESLLRKILLKLLFWY